MSDSGDVGQLTEQLAAQGREVLAEQLRAAYADAALTHADVVSLDPARIDSLVQRAVDNADGLQWRRALASAASEQLGISVVDAMSHPAVAQAQQLAGAPSYEKSLSDAMSSVSASQPTTEPAAAEPAAAAEADKVDGQVAEDKQPEAEGTGDEPEEATYVPAEQEAAARFTEEEVAQANAPTQTYQAATADAGDEASDAAEEAPDDEDASDAEVSEDADDASDSEGTSGADDAFGAGTSGDDDASGEGGSGDEEEEDAAPSPLAGLAKAKPVIDPHATQVHDMAAEFAAQDRVGTQGAGQAPAAKPADEPATEVPAATSAARRPDAPVRPIPPTARPDVEADPDATVVRGPSRPDSSVPPRRPGAPVRPVPKRDPEPTPYPDDDEYDDELRVPAIHLGGVANLPTRGEPLDVRISEAGLDILQANEEILGRLQWSDIGRLEVSGPKGRLFGGNKGGSRLLVRTQHGDATFEIPDLSPEELRTEVAEMSARYGR